MRARAEWYGPVRVQMGAAEVELLAFSDHHCFTEQARDRAPPPPPPLPSVPTRPSSPQKAHDALSRKCLAFVGVRGALRSCDAQWSAQGGRPRAAAPASRRHQASSSSQRRHAISSLSHPVSALLTALVNVAGLLATAKGALAVAHRRQAAAMGGSTSHRRPRVCAQGRACAQRHGARVSADVVSSRGRSGIWGGGDCSGELLTTRRCSRRGGCVGCCTPAGAGRVGRRKRSRPVASALVVCTLKGSTTDF